MSYWYFEKHELKLTPSISDGYDVAEEAECRKEGARFIMQLGAQLGLGYATIATGIVYFHRFYLFHSFGKVSKYLAACCCLFLSGKAEETPKRAKDIVRTAKDLLTDLEFKELGEDPKGEMMMLEKTLLTTIHFDFHIDHPYKYLLKYAKSLKGRKGDLEKLVQMAWTFINDSLCTTICIQFQPEVIAIAFIYLASKMTKFEIIDWENRKANQSYWWEVYAEGITLKLIEDICHELLDVYCSESSKKAVGEAGADKTDVKDKSEDRTICHVKSENCENGYSKTETSSFDKENKHRNGTMDSVSEIDMPSRKRKVSSECYNVLDVSAKATANLTLNEDVWNALKKIQVTNVPACQKSANIVIQQNILSTSCCNKMPSLNFPDSNFKLSGSHCEAASFPFPPSNSCSGLIYKPQPLLNDPVSVQLCDFKPSEVGMPQTPGKLPPNIFFSSSQLQNDIKKVNYNDNIMDHRPKLPTNLHSHDSFHATQNANSQYEYLVDQNSGSDSLLQAPANPPQGYCAQAMPVSNLQQSFYPPMNHSASAEPLYSPVGPSYSPEEPSYIARGPPLLEESNYFEYEPPYFEEESSYFEEEPPYFEEEPPYFEEPPYLPEGPHLPRETSYLQRPYLLEGPSFVAREPSYSPAPTANDPAYVTNARYSSLKFSIPKADTKTFSKGKPHIYC